MVNISQLKLSRPGGTIINNIMSFNTIYESILKNINSNEEFLKKRAHGAKKIKEAAKKKGGPSMLTAYHFKAKEVPYKECLRNIEDKQFAKDRAEDCFKKLAKWDKMTQKEFQEVMGRLEVYGEWFLHLK